MIIYLKRLKSSKFVRVKAFPMYGGIGVLPYAYYILSVEVRRRPNISRTNIVYLLDPEHGVSRLYSYEGSAIKMRHWGWGAGSLVIMDYARYLRERKTKD